MDSVEFKEECRRLLYEIHNVLGKIIKDTKSSDEKAKVNNVPWFERHRLHVLIEMARSSLRQKDDEMLEPWFIVELQYIVELVKNWRKADLWKHIEPELKSKTSFLHAIGQLTLHDILLASGNNVKIVSTEKRPTPDLVLKAKGGTQETVFIEIYHPQRFSGKVDPLSLEDLSKIVKKSMKKAKRQLSESHPGIIAIIGHSQHPANLLKFKELLAKRLDETNRPNLAGIIVMNIAIRIAKKPSGTSFTRTVHLGYIRNPSYFGKVGFITDGAEETSLTIPIVERVTAISTNELIGKKISDIDLNSKAIVEESYIERKIRTLHLDKFYNPNPDIDTIITSEKEIALFVGDSNHNYVCSNCGMILAKNVWQYSLIDIIIKCPKCHFILKVPLKRADFPILPYIQKVLVPVGEYNWSDCVRVKRNVSIFGGYIKPTVKK